MSARRPRRWLRLLGILLAVLILAPPAAVLLYAVIPPPATILMIQRAAQGEGWDYRWRSLSRISPHLVRAVIASEDARFCSHHGFDMEAIEAAWRENQEGGRVRGGSTISQQTAKNVFLWPGRDWVRKGLETTLVPLTETLWGKRRTMELYLNVAEWAPGVYGAEAASHHWFGKSAANLTRQEAARLAAILPSPRRYQAASPGPYDRRRAGRIQAAMNTVASQGLASCVLPNQD